MDIKKVLLLWSMKFLDKNSTGSGVTTLVNNKLPLGLATQQLAEGLHKPNIKNF